VAKLGQEIVAQALADDAEALDLQQSSPSRTMSPSNVARLCSARLRWRSADSARSDAGAGLAMSMTRTASHHQPRFKDALR